MKSWACLLALLALSGCKKEEPPRDIQKVTVTSTREPEATVSVLVARYRIQTGASVVAEMVETRAVPKKYVQPGAISDLAEVSQLVTVAPMVKGEQVVSTKFDAPPLSRAIPDGYRAITISVRRSKGITQHLTPGDRIDIYGVYREYNKETRKWEEHIRMIREDVLVLRANGGGQVAIAAPQSAVPVLIKAADEAKLTVSLRQQKMQAEAER